MKAYQVTKLNDGQHIVREVNANVAELTFKSNEKTQLADLYTSPNECDCFVGHGTCQPINATFVETVVLNF